MSSTPSEAPWWRRWRAWFAVGAVLAVALGSASCQASGRLAAAPTICGAARQDVAVYENRAKSGQAVRPNGRWLSPASDEPLWQDVTTLVAFIKNYC